MEHSIALVTGTTSGLGHAAARMLAIEGYRQVIVTGRSLARVQETAAQLAAETKTQVFTPLELDLDAPTSVQSALAELVRLGRPIDFLLLNAGLIPGKERVLTAAGIEDVYKRQCLPSTVVTIPPSARAQTAITSAAPARLGSREWSATNTSATA